MSERTHNFDLKLLTTSKDVGLRRLRSYAASLGGGAQIFHSGEDLRRSLEAQSASRGQSIVVHDTALVLGAQEIHALGKLARVFQLHQPRGSADIATPTRGTPCWELESYMRCTMAAFFDSPVVRMSMAHLCKAHGPFHLEHLLRWGYATQTWHASRAELQIADASDAFVKSLNLSGEGRRLAEMASHFLQTRLRGHHLAEQAVTFGSDGLTTTVIARCEIESGYDLALIAADLRIHDFPYAIVNQIAPGLVEIGALYHTAAGDERVVMTFHKDASLSQEQPQTQAQGIPRLRLEKAG